MRSLWVWDCVGWKNKAIRRCHFDLREIRCAFLSSPFLWGFFYRLNDWSIDHEIIGRLIDVERNKIWLQQFSTKNNPIQILKHPVRTNYNNLFAPEPHVLVLVHMTHRSSVKKLNKSHAYENNSAQYTTTSQLWVQSFKALWILWKAVRCLRQDKRTQNMKQP